MKTRFRIAQNDTITGHLYNKDGKLLTQIYDSGFTNIGQVKSILLKKMDIPPKIVRLSIHNEDKQTYWTNQ